MKSHQRHKRIKSRKNFLPSLSLAIGLWTAWGWLVSHTTPNSNFLLISFYLLLFFATFLTTALLLANSRRGFLLSLTVITFLIFRYYQLANPLNLILLAGVIISFELYFR